ncbi:L-gulono-1,4-lactone dehydrogenase-like [Amphiura filiformis]|uniref:L-gulono-1,4-lactone dehydrogenase-like n=1 Tax=Amphiura filiformis TaxID=82378 RepID=UPI003B21A429
MAALALRCCCGLEPCIQCRNQSIKVCGCGNRKVFYNFDGTVTVEPLVSYFKPTNSLARKNLIKGMAIDKDVLKKGLSAVEQIAAVVHFAHDNQLSARAVGTGSSWSKLTTVRDILIDMTNLNKILDAKPQNSTGSIYHIEVQAGKVLNEFVREIDGRFGMALPTLPPYTKMTVGGVVSTSTHGPGQRINTMSNFAVELHMVIAKGIQVKIRLPRKEGDVDEDFESVKCKIEAAKYGDPTIEICSTDIFRAAAVGLGSLGIIYSVTFECIAAYNVKETRRNIEIKWPSKKQSKRFKIPSELTDLSSDDHLTISINPFPMESKKKAGRVVLSSGYILSERTDERSTRMCNCMCCCTERECQRCCRPDCLSQVVQTDCAANCMQSLSNCFPACIPSITDFTLNQVIRQQDSDDIDKWYNIFGFFRGQVHASEAGYFIPRDNLDNALADIVRIMQELLKYRVYSLLPLYVRMVKADDLYLSPVNRRRPDGTQVDYYAVIDVPFTPGAYGIDEYHKKLADHLFTRYKARPHWGKNLFLNLDQIDQLYPDLDKWKRVYLLFNSDGTFDNEFTRNVGFEDFRHSEGCRLRNPTEDQIPTVSAQASYHLNYAEVSHEDQHISAISSKVTKSKVISSQPRSSRHHHPNTDGGRSHFIPVPMSQYRR